MAAPVRNSVELDAMRELHLVLCFNPLALSVSLLLPSFLDGVCLFAFLDLAVVAELVCVGPVARKQYNRAL